jgi:hypothetical protein
MWAWFHERAVEVQAGAAIVQAFAALVTAGLTVALVWATRRYVGLTADLATAATAEAERHRQAATARRLRFCSLVGRLELLVASLPDNRDESRIRAAAHVWRAEDVEEFLALASSMGDATAVDAESAGPSLRWLAGRIRYVQSVPPSVGVDWDEQVPAADWARHLTLARTALVSIDRRETPAGLAAAVA